MSKIIGERSILKNDHGFRTLFVAFERQNSRFLPFYYKSKLFNSFKLPYKIRLLAFRSPLTAVELQVFPVKVFLSLGQTDLQVIANSHKLNFRRDLRWVAKRTRKFPRKHVHASRKKKSISRQWA